MYCRQATDRRPRQAWADVGFAEGFRFVFQHRSSAEDEPRHLTLITLMAGVAVHDTLDEFGLRPDIKWVNDILVNEKKIAGILAETVETEKGLGVVVGIGINIKLSNFPPEIAETVTSLEIETDRTVTFSELEKTLVRFLNYFYEILQSRNGTIKILKEWQRRSSYFSGKHVTVRLANETVTGTTDGLEPNGALRVRKTDGETVTVTAGEVERLRVRTGSSSDRIFNDEG